MKSRRMAGGKDEKSIIGQFFDQATGLHQQHESLKEHAAHLRTATGQRIKLVLGGVAERLQDKSGEMRESGKAKIAAVGVDVAHRISHKLHRIADKLEYQAHQLQNKVR